MFLATYGTSRDRCKREWGATRFILWRPASFRMRENGATATGKIEFGEMDRQDFLILPSSRAEATERGLDRFFTGVPCVHGHAAPR